MSRRTRQRRSRPRRDKGGGIGAPSRSKTQSKWDEVGKRVNVSYDVLGHPYHRTKPVEEGKHYTVLAYTDWADTFVPTVIQWNHGEVDSFTNPGKSLLNQSRAIQHAKASSMSQSIRLPESKIPELKEAVQQMKKAAKEEKEKYGKPGPMTLKDLRYYQAELRKEREKSRRLKPDTRDRVKAGDKVTANWFDDSRYYKGVVKRDTEGLYIETPNGRGYLKDAHHVTTSAMSQSIKLPGEKKARAESGAVKKPVRVKKMFERHGVPYYGIWNQEKQKWLHEDGSWTDPYPEKGLMWYAIKPEIAKQKLKEIKPSDMSHSIKLPIGGGTLKVGSKEYVWRTGDRSYEAAQEKAEDLRSRGHKAVIRKEQVAGRPTYVVYARKEGER